MARALLERAPGFPYPEARTDLITPALVLDSMEAQ